MTDEPVAYAWEHNTKFTDTGWKENVTTEDPRSDPSCKVGENVRNVRELYEGDDESNAVAWQFHVHKDNARGNTFDETTHVSFDDPRGNWRDDHEISDVTPLVEK